MRNRIKIITIIGDRPQFIKAATVSREIERYGSDITEGIVHTGQHFDDNMSGVFFRELEIPMPDYNLGIGGGNHEQNTGRDVGRGQAAYSSGPCGSRTPFV